MIRVVVSSRAQRDADRLEAWLEVRSPGAAARVGSLLADAVLSLRELPERNPESEGVRRLIVPFGRSGYVIVYHVTGDVVTVTRIWHGREARRGA